MAPPAPVQAGQPGPVSWMFGSVIGLRSSANPEKLNLLLRCFWVMFMPSCGLAITTIGSVGKAIATPVAALTPTVETTFTDAVRYQVPLFGVCRYTNKVCAPLRLC